MGPIVYNFEKIMVDVVGFSAGRCVIIATNHLSRHARIDTGAGDWSNGLRWSYLLYFIQPPLQTPLNLQIQSEKFLSYINSLAPQNC